MTARSAFVLRHAVGGLVLAFSLVWAAFLLADAWDVAALRRLSPSPLASALAFLLATASMLVAFPAFWYLVRGVSSGVPPFREMLRLHFLAQLMRHLPGRFFGVAYQIAVARHLATGAQWIGANTAHMGMAVWFSAMLPLVLLWSVGRLDSRVAGPAIALLVIGPWLLCRLADRLLILKHESVGVSRVLGVLGAARACTRSSGFLTAMVWFFASWVIYACAWMALGASISGVSAIDGLVLCALYSLAWAMGFLVFVTPSGLGVRELAFAALASDYSPELVVYLALVARLGLLSADMLLGVLSLLFGRGKRV